MFKRNKDEKKAKARKKALEYEEKILSTEGLLKGENVWVYDVPITG